MKETSNYPQKLDFLSPGLSSIRISDFNRNYTTSRTPIFSRCRTDLILSEQGLTTSRKGCRLETRRIHDKSYYMRLLLRKGNEIAAEIIKLTKEIYFMRAAQSTQFSFKTAAESAAEELRKLQSTLRDYNVVDDIVNFNGSIQEIDDNYEKVKADNAVQSREVESLFEARKEKELLVSELEIEASQDCSIFDILEPNSSPDVLENHTIFEKTEKDLKLALRREQSELKHLLSERVKLEEECENLGRGHIRGMYYKLIETERKRDAFLEEQNLSDCNILEKNINTENKLLQCLSKATNETKTQIEQIKTQLEKNHNIMNFLQSERKEKLLKLKNRETIIDDFFAVCDLKRSHLMDEICRHQLKIKFTLQNISEKLCYFSLKHENDKTVSFENSELSKLLVHLKEIEKLEHQSLTGINKLRQERISLGKKLAILSDKEALKLKAKEKECELLEEKSQVMTQEDASKNIIKDLKQHHNALKSKLKGNPIFKELSHLEKKWQNLEQENFALSELLSNNVNYLNRKLVAMKMVRHLNESNIALGCSDS